MPRTRRPTTHDIAVDPELGLLHALRITSLMTARTLETLLHDLDPGDATSSLEDPDSLRLARRIASRARALARLIAAYQNARRREWR
jgi:hypothetical protein